jgi:site-specific DNA-methyltransferase (adenine-specific)
VVSSTNDDSLILDPFNGGGTTGVAAKIVGNRKYIGIDIEKDYIDLTIKRCELITNELNKNKR